MDVDQQLAILTNGCIDVVRAEQLRAKLERSVRTGLPLVVKVGFDPTAPDLHLGHVVLIRKMKQFQDLGHKVVYVVGDFTALIGDPTGRSKTRPPLSRAEIDQNAETYKSQIFRILDPERTVIEFNSRWLAALGSEGWIRLAARYNVAQMLERRDFRQRYDARQPIAIHEFLYPLAQAYDSVELRADVELGGTDQLFNLNVGRDIMPSYGLEAQVVMTTPLLVGLDGVEKMSKSVGNYVGVTEPAGVMFGKLMSISDELMWRYYELLTELPPEEIARRREQVASGSIHPKRAKMDLAQSIVAQFHSIAAADEAEAEFERVHVQKAEPLEVTVREHISVAEKVSIEVKVRNRERDEITQVRESDRIPSLSRILVDLGFATSTTEAARTIEQGGVRVAGERITSPTWRPKPGTYMIQVGPRRFAELTVVEAAERSA